MRKSVSKLEKGRKVPFGMRFMESPTRKDKLCAPNMATATEKYTTPSGPSGGLDDGQVVNSDD